MLLTVSPFHSKTCLCQHSGWEMNFGDIFHSSCSGRIFTCMERGCSLHERHAHSTPRCSAPLKSQAFGQKERFSTMLVKGAHAQFYMTPTARRTSSFSFSVFLPSHQKADSQYLLASNKSSQPFSSSLQCSVYNSSLHIC